MFSLRIRKSARRSAASLLLALGAGCVTAPEPEAPPAPLRLTRSAFADLQGWTVHDPRAALAALARSCAAATGRMGDGNFAGNWEDWAPVCEQAARAAMVSPGEARAMIESLLVPYQVRQGDDPKGLFTGYFEPELRGSRTRHGPYQTPLLGVPPDLVTADLGLFRDSLRGQRIAGRVENGRLVPYAARSEIVQNGLPQAPELLFVDDPVDAFFLQIQGSGRVVLDDGTVVRAAYAGQNGHPYTAIGAVLIAEGELAREEVSMQSIRAWLRAHPERMNALMDRNASYVFFTVEPLGDPALGARGSQGVSLTPGISLAVDSTIYPLGLPMWLEVPVPDPDTANPDRFLTRLMVAQDTGGAIRGGLRGDVYWGFGEEAGAIAGRMRSQGELWLLLPASLAELLGGSVEIPVPGPEP